MVKLNDTTFSGGDSKIIEDVPNRLGSKKHNRRISTMMLKRDRVNYKKVTSPTGMPVAQPSIMQIHNHVLNQTKKQALRKPRLTSREKENRQGLILRTKAALSSRIISKILSFYQDNVLDNSMYYEKKFNIERILFLKIFNLYTSMVFITVYTHCMDLSEKHKAGKNSGDDIVVNTMEVDRMVEYAGVDLDIVKNNAFP